jgi:hypothetical protein
MELGEGSVGASGLQAGSLKENMAVRGANLWWCISIWTETSLLIKSKD